MYSKILKYKDVAIFSLLKYVEILVTSFTTFLLAKKIGPEEMGMAIPVLLYITYANYLSLGVNQVVTKNLSRFKTNCEIISFISINLQFILFVSFVNMILAFIILGIKYAIIVSTISIFTILKSFFMSYFRASFKIYVLNKNNLAFSIVLLLSVVLFVNNLRDYLLSWVFSLGLSLVLYFMDDRFFFKKIIKNLCKFPSKSDLTYNLQEGFKLAITGLLTTILLTSDRLLINLMDIPVNLKGSYQLADYLGTAFYMIFTTLFFYFYPKWIENIRHNTLNFRKIFLKKIKTSLTLVPFILLGVFFLSKFIALFVFPEYIGLESYLTLSVYVKLSVIYLSLISLYYVGLDKESYYIKSVKYLVVILLILLIIIYLININFLWIPIVIGTLVFFEVIKKLLYLK